MHELDFHVEQLFKFLDIGKFGITFCNIGAEVALPDRERSATEIRIAFLVPSDACGSCSIFTALGSGGGSGLCGGRGLAASSQETQDESQDDAQCENPFEFLHSIFLPFSFGKRWPSGGRSPGAV